MKKINKRYIFLDISEKNYEALRKNIINFRLTNDKNRGFVLSHVSENSIEGSHVNQENKTEEVTLPNGEKLIFERPIVDIVSFKISLLDTGLLELTNPPKKMSIFIRDLELASDFGIALKSISVNLHNFHNDFIKHFPEARAYFVYVKSASISEQTHASIKIESDKSAYLEGDRHFNLKNKKIDKIGFKLLKQRLEVSQNGSISGTADFIIAHEREIKSMIMKNG